MKNNRFAGLLTLEREQSKAAAIERIQDKKETHAIFDRLWQFLPGNEARKQACRTALYKLWGAVLAGELQNVDGVHNPRIGGQHISAMSSEQQQKCQAFIGYLLDEYKGNITMIAAVLNNWSNRLNLTGTSNEKQQKAFDADPFIAAIRNATGVRPYSERKLTTALPAPSRKKHSQPTAQDHYIEGMIASINDNTEEMLLHLREAAGKNHAAAAWTMWEYLDKHATTAEEKSEARGYLDIAYRGLYWRAQMKIQDLYGSNPPVFTPYFEELRHNATREDASSEEMNTLGLYYQHALNHMTMARKWYKRAIEKDGNNDAQINLWALQGIRMGGVTLTEEEYQSSYDNAVQYAPENSKAFFTLQNDRIAKLNQDIIGADETIGRKALRDLEELVAKGSILATLLVNGFIIINDPQPPSHPATKTKLQYLKRALPYTAGSMGNDSSHPIDIRDPMLDENARWAQHSMFAIDSLAQYATKARATEYSYLVEYQNCMQESLHAANKTSHQHRMLKALNRILSFEGVGINGKGTEIDFRGNDDIVAVTCPNMLEVSKRYLETISTQIGIRLIEDTDGVVSTVPMTLEQLTEACRKVISLQLPQESRSTSITPLSHVAEGQIESPTVVKETSMQLRK